MRNWALFAALSLGLVPTSVDAEPLKVMSWNIANLAQEAGTSLRGDHVRSEADMQIIRDIIEGQNPDIIALQEIGSIAAARNVLGDGYHMAFETQCGIEECESDRGEIFTAIAWKESFQAPVRTVPLDALAIWHEPECEYQEPRRVRGGIGIAFSHEGADYTVLSVHLKASCADERANSRSDVTTHCEVLDQQFAILSSWIEAQVIEGRTVVVAGDFNRKLLARNDRYAAQLRELDASIRVEPTTESVCWPRDYPQSRFWRRELARSAFAEVGSYDWLPYMPSSIGTRDFFVIAGPQSARLGAGEEILMRPEVLVYDPEASGLSREQREAIERQAAEVGVRIGAPSGYLAACESEDPDRAFPTPMPFEDGGVLTFAPVFPSDHCPIAISIGAD